MGSKLKLLQFSEPEMLNCEGITRSETLTLSKKGYKLYTNPLNRIGC